MYFKNQTVICLDKYAVISVGITQKEVGRYFEIIGDLYKRVEVGFPLTAFPKTYRLVAKAKFFA